MLDRLISVALVASGVAAWSSVDPEPPTIAGLSIAQYEGTPGTGHAALLTWIVHDSAGCVTVSQPGEFWLVVAAR